MGAVHLDQLVEFALTALLSGEDQDRRALVRNMATRWPHISGLHLSFALTCAASHIEDTFGREGESNDAHYLAYKLSALVAADLLALNKLGYPEATGRDLLHFWRRADPFFLEL